MLLPLARRLLGISLLLTACAHTPAPPTAPRPAEPARVEVVLPLAGSTVSPAARGHFVLGNVRPPNLRVTVNGLPVHQAPGGGFLGYVPAQPGESVLHVEARPAAGGGPVTSDDVKYKVRGFVPSWEGVVDPGSLRPTDALLLEPGDAVPVYFRGTPGLSAKVTLGAGLAEAPCTPGLPPDRAYQQVTSDPIAGQALLAPGVRDPAEAGGGTWYHAELVVPSPAPERGWRFGSTARLTLHVTVEGKPHELPLPQPLTLRDPSELTAVELSRPTGQVITLADPDGSYFQFLANGTRTTAGRKVGSMVELRLDRQLSVWADAANVRSLAPTTLPQRSFLYAVRTQPLGGAWSRIWLRLDQPIPIQVRENADARGFQLLLFGARTELEFLRFEPSSGPVDSFHWNQETSERLVLDVALKGRAWGFRYGFSGTDFYLDVRAPPRIQKGSVFKGLTFTVDPGHSRDTGAIGPTHLLEKDVNWGVARRLARNLEQAGARVLLTRHGEALPSEQDLLPRTQMAIQSDSELLISVHHNAVPEGINPLDPHDAMGSSTYFYHPQSQGLARALQAALLESLHLPDRGVGLADLALCRPSQMPAVLTEAAFLTVPEQEELLRTEAFQEREAQALFRGLERFLTEVQEEAAHGAH